MRWSGLICCPGKVQGLLSLVVEQVRGRAVSPDLLTLGPALPPARGGKGWGNHSFTYATTMQTRGDGISFPAPKGWLIHISENRVISTVFAQARGNGLFFQVLQPERSRASYPTHLIPGEIQGPISQVLQTVRDSLSSLNIMNSGPTFPPSIGGNE